MILGIAFILTSTVVYNGSVMLLAAVARRQPGDSNLVLAVIRRASGLSAIMLNLLGWSLEVGALVFIPLTLARILSVAGVGVLLGLARWALKEPLGIKELGGSGLVVLGVAAVGLEIPRFGTSPPTMEGWILLLAALADPTLSVPYSSAQHCVDLVGDCVRSGVRLERSLHQGAGRCPLLRACR